MHNFFLPLLFLISISAFGQIEGKWQESSTTDDLSGQIIQIYKKQDGKYYAKIMVPSKNALPNCHNCKDDRKGKPLKNLEIIRGLEMRNNQLIGGSLLDPETGKIYKCKVEYTGNTLTIRKYIGFSFVGRSHTLHRVHPNEKA